MFYSIALFIFVVVCLLLITIILLQSSQSGGMGSIGGGNNFLDGALGSQGADALLLKTTTVLDDTIPILEYSSNMDFASSK